METINLKAVKRYADLRETLNMEEAITQLINESREYNPLLSLTNLQREVGYEPNTMNLVALLGMFGEAGEVLEEVTIELCPKSTGIDAHFLDAIRQARSVAKLIDSIKKAIRDKEYIPNVTITVEPDCVKELADQFYYVNALASCLGASVSQLAIISENKVRTKMLKTPVGHANQ